VGSRCSLELVLSLDHSLNSVVHVLDEVLLGSSETSLVGDIEETLLTLGGFSGRSTDLDGVLVGNSLELGLVLWSAQLWKVDVDGGTEGGSEVGWARSDVTQVVVVSELASLLDLVDGSAESVEDLTDVSSILHGDDSELILLVHPDEESLGIVMEDTSSRWPVTVESASLKESVSNHEEEVILDKLLLNIWVHALEWVELSLEVTLEAVASIDNRLHDSVSLLFGNSWSESEVCEVTSDTDTCRVDHGSLVSWESWGVELAGIHAGDMAVSWLVTVVVEDDLVEELAEGGVRVSRSSVGTNVRICVLATREDASLERNSSSILLVLVLLPDLLGEGGLEKGVAVIWEEWPVDEVIWGGEVASDLGSSGG